MGKISDLAVWQIPKAAPKITKKLIYSEKKLDKLLAKETSNEKKEIQTSITQLEKKLERKNPPVPEKPLPTLPRVANQPAKQVPASQARAKPQIPARTNISLGQPQPKKIEFPARQIFLEREKAAQVNTKTTGTPNSNPNAQIPRLLLKSPESHGKKKD